MADVIEKDLTKVTSSNLTPITKPSSGTDKRYMRMVDKDGNSVDVEVPAFLRAAIRDELASILESGGTGGGSVLSVIGGILKTRTDADLASVLGGVKVYDNAITDCNDRLNITGIAVDFFSSVEPTNMPPSATSHYSIMLTVGKYKSSYPHAFQLWIDHKAYAAYRIHYDNNANKSWKTISTE